MDELERIRHEKLKHLQRQQQEEYESHQQFQQQVDQLETAVKRIFTKEALQRYSNLKMAHSEKAVQVLVLLGQAMEQGKIETVDDALLKDILSRITPQKRETKIRRV